jgi:hypothetical protein
MGLLDDAIREHLELKRLRGADPGEVAREQQDALGSGRRAAEAAADAPADQEGEMSIGVDSFVFEASDPADSPVSAATGQETVEINMEAELHSPAAEEAAARADGGAAPIEHPAHTPSDAEESLEWEVPGDKREGTDNQAGCSDDASAQQPEGKDERIEDVLEETPDFLRETPEQDRLWFEQRPPRDFDFNE